MILVAVPYRAKTSSTLVERAKTLAERLTYQDKEIVMFENDGGYVKGYATNANARNEFLAKHLKDHHEYVFWVDVDIVEYPKNIIEKLLEAGGVAAPLVLFERDGGLYDVGGFVQDGKWSEHEWPFFDYHKPVEGVGSVYLIPAKIYYQFCYKPTKGFTEHFAIMQAAKTMGISIQVRMDVLAWHADLFNFGMRYQ